MKPSVRIAAIDTYLPERVRTQADWSDAVVANWKERLATIVPRNAAAAEHMTEGVRLSLEAIAGQSDDPFQAAKSAHVIDEKDSPSDLDTRAAQNALASAGLTANDVDILVTQAMCADLQCTNQASIVHQKLGLRAQTPAFVIDGICTSFVHQMDFARRAILAGDAKVVLATQSSACTRIMPHEEPISAWHGDAGAAAVLVESEPGYGLLSVTTRTDGSMHKAFCASVPGRRWHDEGRVVACSEDRPAARRMQLQSADVARELLDEALDRAGAKRGDVKFFACHQPVAWLPAVCRQHAGLVNAAILPTFSWTGSISSVNIPIQITMAAREGLLKRGDLVAMFALASGMTAAAAILRWS